MCRYCISMFSSSVLLIAFWFLNCKAEDIRVKPRISSPDFNKPFAIIWNVNNTDCELSDILDNYGIIHNSGLSYQSSDIIALYYEKAFRYFPKYDSKTKSWVNGGIPQNASDNALTADFARTLKYLASAFHGLGVLDWETWRALYNRMNGTIYQTRSLEFVRSQYPNVTDSQALAIARYQYDTATRKLMEGVLEVGKILQPKGRWGFYLYPDCRYYDFAKNNYSCTEDEKSRNDEIQWLFDSSTALFPSMYIAEYQKDKKYVVPYVAGRIQEALRVERNRPSEISIPIYSYHMLSYKKEHKFIDPYDLLDSIGVASFLGGSGAIIWGSFRYTQTQAKCDALRTYLGNVLGPFCMKMMDSALECSISYCNFNGRCVITKKDNEQNSSYLSASEVATLLRSFKNRSYYKVFRELSLSAAIKGFPTLSCQCYDNWHGEDCLLQD